MGTPPPRGATLDRGRDAAPQGPSAARLADDAARQAQWMQGRGAGPPRHGGDSAKGYVFSNSELEHNFLTSDCVSNFF